MNDTATCPLVVIQGLGLVHPAASAARLTQVTPAELEGAGFASQLAELGSRFARASLRRLPEYVRTGLLAAVRALDAAGLAPCPSDLPVVVGTAYACQKYSFDFMDSMLDSGPRLASPLTFSYSVNNMAPGIFCLMFGTSGAGMSVNTGCLSFAGAVETAAVMLERGRAEHVLVGAMDECDARLTGLFSDRGLIPGSVFLVLGLGRTGVALDVEWLSRPVADAAFEVDGRRVCLCSAGAHDPLFQALACASFSASDAEAARAVQTDADFGLTASVRLRRVF